MSDLFQLVSSLYENNANSGFAPPPSKVQPPAEATIIEVEGFFDSLIYLGRSSTHCFFVVVVVVFGGFGLKDKAGD